MALNIFEELDLTSSGDNVDEGFLKVKNNWATMDTELHNARGGVATLDTRLDAVDTEITAARGGEVDMDTRFDDIETEITAARDGEADMDTRFDNVETDVTNMWLGALRRPLFTWKDADEIYISGGLYECNGKVVKITSQLTSPAIVTGGTDWHYLYIDYSAVPADGVIDNTDIYWSTTEPAWSHAKMGWYHSAPTDDRCIFAVNTITNDIPLFYHSGELYQYSLNITVESGTGLTASFADATALTMPSFARKANATFRALYGSATANLDYRTNGASGNGMIVGRCTAGSVESHMRCDVITDSSHVIEWRDQDNTDATFFIFQHGWYFPEGM